MWDSQDSIPLCVIKSKKASLEILQWNVLLPFRSVSCWSDHTSQSERVIIKTLTCRDAAGSFEGSSLCYFSTNHVQKNSRDVSALVLVLFRWLNCTHNNNHLLTGRQRCLAAFIGVWYLGITWGAFNIIIQCVLECIDLMHTG